MTIVDPVAPSNMPSFDVPGAYGDDLDVSAELLFRLIKFLSGDLETGFAALGESPKHLRCLPRVVF